MNTDGLLPHQIISAEHLVRTLNERGAVLDASEMGTGKTFVAGAVLRHFNFPSLVVCPDIAQTQWRRMGELLGVEFETMGYEMLRTGRTPYGSWQFPKTGPLKSRPKCLYCQCWVDDSKTRCPYHMEGIHCVERKQIPHEYGHFVFNRAVKMLVFDEIHRCGATDSLNSDMLVSAKRQGIPTLGLSATAASSPLQFRALGYLLGLHTLDDFWKWARRYNCRPSPHGGFYFAGNEDERRVVMAGLNAKLFPDHGVRVRTKDLKDFPECQITAELYDLKEKNAIEKLYQEMEEAIEELRAKAAEDRSTVLTRVLRALQEIELLKVPIFQQVTEDAVAQGYSVAIFVSYTQTLDELCKRLKTDCRIDGSQVGESGRRRRQKCIDSFQAGDDRVLVANSAAGGVAVSLPDTRGDSPRLGVVSPCQSAVNIRQVFGRLPRIDSKSKSLYRVILAAGTREVNTHRNLSRKLNQLDSLNDADLLGTNLNLTEHELSTIFRA